MTDRKIIPSFPYGDPGDDWQIDRDDFYKFVDAAFDRWHDKASSGADLGSAMPYELTAAEPAARLIRWTRLKRLPEHREFQRPVHPEVAAEAERIDMLPRGTREITFKQFAPSALAAYRAGFAEGANREFRRHNDEWGGSLAYEVLRSSIRRDGVEEARLLLERVITDLAIQADTTQPVPESRGLES